MPPWLGLLPSLFPRPLRPTPILSLKNELANKSAGEKSLSEEYIVGVLTPKHPGPRDSKILNFELLTHYFPQQADPDYVPGPRRRRPANRRPRAPRPRPVAATTPAAPAARDPPRVPLTALGNPRGTPSSSVSGSARQGQTNNRDDQSHDGDATPSNPTQGRTSPYQHDRQAPRSSPPPGGPRPGSVILPPSSGTPSEPVPAGPAREGSKRAVTVGTSESTARDHAGAEQSNPARTGGSAVPVPRGDEQSIPVPARGSAVPVPEGDDEPVPVRTRGPAAPVPSLPFLLGTPTRCVRGHARAEQSNPAQTGGSAVPVPGGDEQSIPVLAGGSAVPVPGGDEQSVPVLAGGSAVPVPGGDEQSIPVLAGGSAVPVPGGDEQSIPVLAGGSAVPVPGGDEQSIPVLAGGSAVPVPGGDEQSIPVLAGGSAVPVPGGDEQSVPVLAGGSAVPVPGGDDDSVSASTREGVPDPSFKPRNTQSTIDEPSDNDSSRQSQSPRNKFRFDPPPTRLSARLAPFPPKFPVSIS
ncbi:PREDICTED: uncharacterized protein LOC109474404 [Branchiostoma belcheri]|uniref:Uncharacterized protein LOC109474404 n=1 Tax=Branchiostoma belcheri TaxID=7741 RepID=A0A6P4Z8P9_BRABE|nr:PREDICTED: uncharacterized protein LOC109474404 [Branchiostoma belcheri]